MTMLRSPAAPQRGFSLIELMISMVIGLVVIGAVLATYLASGTAARNNLALSQVTEDGNIALNVMRQQISMVGYSRPIAVVSGGDFTLAYAGVGIDGCDTSFTDASVAIEALGCPTAAANAPDAIAVAFEVDASSTPVTSNRPLDCVGNELTLGSPTGTAAGQSVFLSYSRFYLATPSGAARTALYCYGSGSNTPQVLANNVIDLQVKYGIRGTAVDGKNRGVSYYTNAANVTDAMFATEVAAVRVCVVVASTDEVMDEKTPYQPCDPFASPTTPDDKRLYRAFSTTVVLQNRLGALVTGT